MKAVGEAQFSPDGLEIAFGGGDGEKLGLFKVSSKGGTPKIIYESSSRYHLPIWSIDGDWIYFTLDETGKNEIYKIESDGTGKPIQVARKGGFLSKITPDGKTFYYTKSKHDGGIWRMPMFGGPEEFMQNLSDAGFKQKYSEDVDEFGSQWTMTDEGIYFLARNSGGNFLIKFYNFSTEQISQAVGDYKIPENIYFRSELITNGTDFFFCLRGDRTSSIMLAELP